VREPVVGETISLSYCKGCVLSASKGIVKIEIKRRIALIGFQIWSLLA
jgi:hypothetical protein